MGMGFEQVHSCRETILQVGAAGNLVRVDTGGGAVGDREHESFDKDVAKRAGVSVKTVSP